LTPLSRSPSSGAPRPLDEDAPAHDRPETVVPCGPVAVAVSAETVDLLQRALDELQQFAAPWADAAANVRVHLRRATAPAPMGEGRFLHCSALRVDATADGLLASCHSGASGLYDRARQQWDLRIVNSPRAAGEEDHVEDLLELALTTAWRAAGWIPLHAGAVVRGGSCALLMAPAKGGKSTLTAAMVHRGWRTLGDDKALLGVVGGQPEVRGLAREFNLDPATRRWFPEVGDLQRLPPLSRWNAKRRVAIETVWGDCVELRAVPAWVVVIQRDAGPRPTRVSALSAREVLSALLHQTVVPSDAATAREILAALARTARTMRGLRLQIGADAYADPRNLDVLEERLR
jgi:hypothetical protein